MTKQLLIAVTALMAAAAIAEETSIGNVNVTHRPIEGIGAEAGVMRRDPNDIIKVGDLDYVWYSKGKISPGYDATIWYATSKDRYIWTEKGMALAKGEPGGWEGASVFTPNILVAEGRYLLFYTGTSREYGKGFNPDSKIGIAVSDSPDGPWERLTTNPVLKNSDDPNDFDSHLVDDACLITREGKYWLYYKSRQLGKTPGQTQMGLAIADHPEGPYVRHEAGPVIPGNHEVLVWPQRKGVAAMIGTTGPKQITNSILYAEDGVHFSKTHRVVDGPWAAEHGLDRGDFGIRKKVPVSPPHFVCLVADPRVDHSLVDPSHGAVADEGMPKAVPAWNVFPRTGTKRPSKISPGVVGVQADWLAILNLAERECATGMFREPVV